MVSKIRGARAASMQQFDPGESPRTQAKTRMFKQDSVDAGAVLAPLSPETARAVSPATPGVRREDCWVVRVGQDLVVFVRKAEDRRNLPPPRVVVQRRASWHALGSGPGNGAYLQSDAVSVLFIGKVPERVTCVSLEWTQGDQPAVLLACDVMPVDAFVVRYPAVDRQNALALMALLSEQLNYPDPALMALADALKGTSKQRRKTSSRRLEPNRARSNRTDGRVVESRQADSRESATIEEAPTSTSAVVPEVTGHVEADPDDTVTGCIRWPSQSGVPLEMRAMENGEIVGYAAVDPLSIRMVDTSPGLIQEVSFRLSLAVRVRDGRLHLLTVVVCWDGTAGQTLMPVTLPFRSRVIAQVPAHRIALMTARENRAWFRRLNGLPMDCAGGSEMDDVNKIAMHLENADLAEIRDRIDIGIKAQHLSVFYIYKSVELMLLLEQWHKARDICMRLLRTVPGDPNIQAGLAYACMQLGEPDSAAEALNCCLASAEKSDRFLHLQILLQFLQFQAGRRSGEELVTVAPIIKQAWLSEPDDPCLTALMVALNKLFLDGPDLSAGRSVTEKSATGTVRPSTGLQSLRSAHVQLQCALACAER